MKRPGLLFIFYFFCSAVHSQIIETDTVYSTFVKDKFVITIRKPAGFSLAKQYHYVYLTDAGIGIGEYVFGKSASWSASVPSTCVIIGISHLGDWHEKRPRDFIPTDSSKNSSENFGKADRFYLFMKNELIPKVEKKLKNKKDRSFVGHSFGGLFCLYTLLQTDKLFDRHFAISPSIWANYYELDKLEAQYSRVNRSLKANLTLYVGGLEFLNKVLFSTRSFYDKVLKRNYAGLFVEKIEIGNANHYSIRKPAVDRIFKILSN